MKRRDFIKTTALAGAGIASAGLGLTACTGGMHGKGGIGSGMYGADGNGTDGNSWIREAGNAPVPYNINRNGAKARMHLTFFPYELQLQHTFTVSSYSRTTTPDVQVEIEYDGFVGYGEASMPPYLGHTVESVCAFLQKVDLEQFSDPFQMEDILNYVDSLSEGDAPAKAAVDIALHDLVGKLIGQPWFRIWGLNAEKASSTTFTIGIDTPDVVREKTLECAGKFNILGFPTFSVVGAVDERKEPLYRKSSSCH